MIRNISQTLQNHVGSSVRKTNKNMHGLSTGKRINSASDDTAGSAIISRMNARVRSIAAANRNINDALEAVSLSEAGSEMVYKHLLAMHELAIQATNGVYSDEERAMMQLDYQAHQEQIQSLSLGSVHQDHLSVLNAGWVQLAFGIDVSGSMGGEIANLQQAINGGTSSLASLLDNNSIYTQFALTAVGSREDTIDGNHDGADTKAVLGDPDFSIELDALGASGQWEDPYAAIMSMVGAIGDDAVGFSTLADQRHIVYITDTGQEYSADATATKAAAMQALVQNGITFHAIVSGGGPSALNDLVTATGGKTFPLASDGSNIASALDDVNDFILDNADDKRPTPMLVGPENSNIVNAEVPVNMTLNALSLQFSKSDIRTVAAADTAITQLADAITHYTDQRALLGATYQQLESALSENLNQNINNQEFASNIEDADMATMMTESVSSSLKSDTSTKMLQKWFEIRSQTLGLLLS